MKDERNMMALADMVKTFKSYSLLFGGERSPSSTPGPPSGPSPEPSPEPSPGPTTGIVGRVGSTGASTGPHIHIETGDGYTGKVKKFQQQF